MKTMRKTKVSVVALLLPLFLIGCGEAKKQLGFDKQAPDEFTVVTRAPLNMPPDYNLRPPQPGAPQLQEGNMRDKARQTLVGNANKSSSSVLRFGGGGTTVSTPGGSQGEKILLKKAGADNADPAIRRVVDQETTMLAETDRSFTDKLIFWRKSEDYNEPVDPTKESRRLKENQALGKAITDGETPTIKRKKKGILEGIIN